MGEGRGAAPYCATPIVIASAAWQSSVCDGFEAHGLPRRCSSRNDEKDGRIVATGHFRADDGNRHRSSAR